MTPSELAGVAIRAFKAQVAVGSLSPGDSEQRQAVRALRASLDDTLPLLSAFHELRSELIRALRLNVRLGGALAASTGQPLPPEHYEAEQLLGMQRPYDA
jgi:hypothetical protein